MLFRLQPRAIVVLLLIAPGASCRDTPPDVPAPHPWGASSGYAPPSCRETTVDIDEPPVRVEHMTSDWVAPQSTLKGMADAADAIVVGSIVSERFHLSETCFPSTLVTVAVDSVIKDHPRAASADGRLVAWRTGGKRREENIVVRLEEDQFPSFKLGEKYLLLLSRNEIRDRWYVGTPYRTLKVQSSVLTPVADYGPLAASGRGKELVVFAEQLRKIIARR